MTVLGCLVFPAHTVLGLASMPVHIHTPATSERNVNYNEEVTSWPPFLCFVEYLRGKKSADFDVFGIKFTEET